jgi:phage protein D/phage baseplate assembly protein gpV
MPINNSKTLYLSEPLLKLGGVNAPPELMKDILEIIVDESLHMPSMFIIKVHNVYVPASENSETWKNEKYFNIGDRISIGFASSTTEDPEFLVSEKDPQLIEGEITGIEVKFSNTSEAHLVVRGYDASHRLHRGRFNRSFLNSTDSDIVRRIASEARIQIGQVDTSGSPHEYVFQENQTNMEFLRERAARIGFELFIQNDKLYFREPKSEESLNLEWLTDISSFDVWVTSAEQVSSVEVHSWDYTKKELISETVSKEQLVTETGNGDGSGISQKFKMKESPKMIVVDQPVSTAKEAKQMAQALCNELSGEFVTADAKAEGNPKIRPGKVVALNDMGTRYSGKYYITETCHRYSNRIYKTDFTVRGLREGSLLSTLPPKTHLQPGQTLLVGLVTNNKDPKGWGRVKVKFPTLTMDDESHWARVVGLGASNDRGFYCLPEIDDEVLVGFEHGDIHRPYIVGGVWNGKDKTVETVDDTIKNGKVRLRTIKTRTGHTIQFVEEDDMRSKAGIYIETNSGHRIDMNDSEDFIEIKTQGGHFIKMDDGASRKIEIKTPGLQSITLDDIARQISISTLAGMANVKAGKIELDAEANINMLAPTITIEGAVNIAGALTVEGAVNVAGAFAVEGGANLAGGIAMEGGVAIAGAAAIDGVPIV